MKRKTCQKSTYRAVGISGSSFPLKAIQQPPLLYSQGTSDLFCGLIESEICQMQEHKLLQKADIYYLLKTGELIKNLHVNCGTSAAS